MTKEELEFEEAASRLFQDDTATTEGATDEDAETLKATPQEAADALMASLGCHLESYTAADRSQLPTLAPELIDGILRQGHTMILSGPTKSGKSMLAIELALAVSEGGKWLDHRCARFPVLYVNCEVDSRSFDARVYATRSAMGMTGAPTGDLHILSTRGTGMTLSGLRDPIITMCKAYGIGLVILDPIYMLLEGDENSNSDTRGMAHDVEAIAELGHTSVCMIHHFAKGNASMRSAMDRAVGAGVFTRSPDAILTMTALDVAPPETDPDATAYRMDMSLREFRNPVPFGLWYRYPTHVVDHELDDSPLLGVSATARTADDRKENENSLLAVMMEADHTERLQEVEDDPNGSGIYGIALTDAMEIYETTTGKAMTRTTMQRRLTEAGYCVIGHRRNGRATVSLYGDPKKPITKHTPSECFFS